MDLKICNQIHFMNEQENERNNLDIIARKIFNLLNNKDSNSLKVDYRQRFFEFNDDLTHYYTGYEMLINKSEVIPVIHLVFDKIDNKWILTDINTD